jgi:hypothetical protein
MVLVCMSIVPPLRPNQTAVTRPWESSTRVVRKDMSAELAGLTGDDQAIPFTEVLD